MTPRIQLILDNLDSAFEEFLGKVQDSGFLDADLFMEFMVSLSNGKSMKVMAESEGEAKSKAMSKAGEGVTVTSVKKAEAKSESKPGGNGGGDGMTKMSEGETMPNTAIALALGLSEGATDEQDCRKDYGDADQPVHRERP